jgi:surfactin synthase thioesterase subunit/acyl carrier protein
VTELLRLLEDAQPQDRIGIVYLRAFDARLANLDSPATASQTNALVCGGVVDLAKTLDRVRDRFADPPLLWLVSGGIEAAPAQNPLWGLGRSFALEYPEMWGGLIDLPDGAALEDAAGLVLRELQACDGENQVRHRNEKRLAPRLVHLAGHADAKAGLAADATYWIIGGLGRLGLETAEALIEAGARHLVLTGRRKPDPRIAAALESLSARARLRIIPADIADNAAVAAAVSEISATMPPLKGVIHAAAVFEDALLVNADQDLFERVLRPKVAGTWNLHRATSGLDLDFFVLFSTVLSLWGAAGQAAYTAANGFLDALAHYRRDRGLPATVFNWGPWQDANRWGAVGAAMWKQRATNALSAKTCLKVLLSHLSDGPAQIVVTDTNWRGFLAQFAQTPPLYRELALAEIPAAACCPGPTQAEEAIAFHAAQTLGLAGRIDTAQPLNELGLDSLLAVTLANRLRRAFDRAVPTAALLKGPSVRELAAQLFPERAPTPGAAEPKAKSAASVAGNRWLVIHQPNPAAKMRLLAFPFAGGGAATFRTWASRLDSSIELVAIEPPGRQTRIDEAPIRNLEILLRQLIPELLAYLDKPFAVYGHCLGALTLFETVRRLIRVHAATPIHVFVSGARPPDELQRQQDFEVGLSDRLLGLPDYNLFEPVYRQPDAVFGEAIRCFNVLATENLVQDAELSRLILPAIRAEFEMASDYRYEPEAAWDVPITCFTGANDAYVSADNARSWARFTRKRFQLFTLDSEHFIVVDDDQYLLQVINRELTSTV